VSDYIYSRKTFRRAERCVRLIFLSVLAALACSCQRSVGDAADRADVDVSQMQKTFACAGNLDGDAVQACRILAEFGSAHAFTRWPAETESWWGRKYCNDGRSDGTSFAALHLQAGRGKSPSGSAKPDDAMVLPSGGEYPLMTVSAATLTEWTPLLDAVRVGKVPELKTEMARNHYESLKRPAVADSAYMLTRTDGASFRGGAGIGRYYGRGSGEKLLIVEPRTGTSSCVAELWKVL